jgi:hypothetical protein
MRQVHRLHIKINFDITFSLVGYINRQSPPIPVGTLHWFLCYYSLHSLNMKLFLFALVALVATASGAKKTDTKPAEPKAEPNPNNGNTAAPEDCNLTCNKALTTASNVCLAKPLDQQLQCVTTAQLAFKNCSDKCAPAPTCAVTCQNQLSNDAAACHFKETADAKQKCATDAQNKYATCASKC